MPLRELTAIVAGSRTLPAVQSSMRTGVTVVEHPIPRTLWLVPAASRPSLLAARESIVELPAPVSIW